MLIVASALAIVAMLLGIRNGLKWRKERDRIDKEEGYSSKYREAENKSEGWTIISSIVGTAFVCLTVIPLGFVLYKTLSTPYKIAYQRDKIAIMQERYEAQADMVRIELAKYPEYERAVIDKIDPLIVLSWPQLHTHETIMELVKSVLALKDSVYDAQVELKQFEYDYDFSRNVLLFVP